MPKSPLPQSFGRSTKPKEQVDELEALRRRAADVAGMVNEARAILGEAADELLRLSNDIQQMQIAKLQAAIGEQSDATP